MTSPLAKDRLGLRRPTIPVAYTRLLLQALPARRRSGRRAPPALRDAVLAEPDARVAPSQWGGSCSMRSRSAAIRASSRVRAAAEADRARFSRLCDADRAGHPGSARRHAALLPDAQSPISPDLCRRRTRRDARTARRTGQPVLQHHVMFEFVLTEPRRTFRNGPDASRRRSSCNSRGRSRLISRAIAINCHRSNSAAPPARCGSRATCSTGRCRSPTKSRTGRRSCRWSANTRRCVRRKAISSNACARWHAGRRLPGTGDARRRAARVDPHAAARGRRFELSAIARRSAVSRREAVAHRVGSRPEDDRRTAAIHRPGELHARVPALGRANAECVS